MGMVIIVQDLYGSGYNCPRPAWEQLYTCQRSAGRQLYLSKTYVETVISIQDLRRDSYKYPRHVWVVV